MDDVQIKERELLDCYLRVECVASAAIGGANRKFCIQRPLKYVSTCMRA
jgi:hypothetical protein